MIDTDGTVSEDASRSSRGQTNMFPVRTHTHTLTLTHNQASPQTCESSLTSINVKECRGYFAPLSIELLKSLSPEGHRTLHFHPVTPCCCFLHCTGDYKFQHNQYLCHRGESSSSWSIHVSTDALDRMVITTANSLNSVFSSPWASFWFSAGQISQIKTQSRGIWGALIQDRHMYASPVIWTFQSLSGP